MLNRSRIDLKKNISSSFNSGAAATPGPDRGEEDGVREAEDRVREPPQGRDRAAGVHRAAHLAKLNIFCSNFMSGINTKKLTFNFKRALLTDPTDTSKH